MRNVRHTPDRTRHLCAECRRWPAETGAVCVLCVAAYLDAVHRRREASRRLPVLPCGHADPLDGAAA